MLSGQWFEHRGEDLGFGGLCRYRATVYVVPASSPIVLPLIRTLVRHLLVAGLMRVEPLLDTIISHR